MNKHNSCLNPLNVRYRLVLDLVSLKLFKIDRYLYIDI